MGTIHSTAFSSSVDEVQVQKATQTDRHSDLVEAGCWGQPYRGQRLYPLNPE